MSAYQDVFAFNTKFAVPMASTAQLLDDGAYNFRVGFLREELNEFVNAQYQQNLPESIDALIDLVYVAYGTAQMMGVSPAMWQEMWDAVQTANMSKVRAISIGESKRKSTLDVIKPDGWVGPQAAHLEIISRYSK